MSSSSARRARDGPAQSRTSCIYTRRRRAGVVGRLILCMVAVALASSEASLFKRKNKQGSGGRSKGRGRGGKLSGKEKVKEDVAWLLEDTTDAEWKSTSDDGRVKVLVDWLARDIHFEHSCQRQALRALIQVWKRSMPGSDFVAIKASATLSASPQALFEVLTPGDIDIVRQYNPLVEDGNDLEILDRDNKAPSGGQYVRAEILHGVFLIKAAKNKKHSEFTMVHHFNPGGNVPAWLMNWLAEGKPMTFVRRLEEVAKKWDVQASLSKNMPCKGRGFADKPCDFLLLKGDAAQAADTTNYTPEGTERRHAVSILVALAIMASGFYGWTVSRDQPKVLGEKKSALAPDEIKTMKEKDESSAVIAVADAKFIRSRNCGKARAERSIGEEAKGKLSRGDTANGTRLEAGGELANADGVESGAGDRRMRSANARVGQAVLASLCNQEATEEEVENVDGQIIRGDRTAVADVMDVKTVCEEEMNRNRGGGKEVAELAAIAQLEGVGGAADGFSDVAGSKLGEEMHHVVACKESPIYCEAYDGRGARDKASNGTLPVRNVVERTTASVRDGQVEGRVTSVDDVGTSMFPRATREPTPVFMG